jgi:hypothetical protein
VKRRFIELTVIPVSAGVGIADALNWQPIYIALLARWRL